MIMRKMFFFLFSVLVLGAMVAAEANAVEVYSAKFNCGAVPVGISEIDVVTGSYLTSINIHNPQTDTTVQFTKKIVLAVEEGTVGSRFVMIPGSLGSNLAEFVDCRFIYRSLGITPGVLIEGFVVIEVPSGLALDVVGKYTARSSAGQVSGLDIVVYSPTSVTH